jgi:prepilin-type processing-associated H-X9-DG protein
LLGEIRSAGPTLGWVSGTHSTLRNTGARLNQDKPLARPAGKLTYNSPRDELFDVVEQAAADGSWPVDLTGGFGSNHASVCNFLFCDGSVRSLKDMIDEHVYRLLGSRADGEMIGSDSY